MKTICIDKLCQDLRAAVTELAPELSLTVAEGGAVLTADYAERIGADFYSKDAMGFVRLAERMFAAPPGGAA